MGCAAIQNYPQKLKRIMTEGLPSSHALSAGHDIGQSLWQSCVDQLAQELPEQQFNTWIKPLSAQVLEDFSKVTIFVANRFKLDWVRAQYSGRISAMLEKMYGQPVLVELAITPRETIARAAPSSQAVEFISAEEGIVASEAAPSGLPKNRINSMLTFDSLVEGTANRMARAAAMHVATIPGHLYNPLFIYGGVGLGKTHLMHAVATGCWRTSPAPKFSTSMQNSLSRMWLKPTSAKLSMSSKSVTTRWICC